MDSNPKFPIRDVSRFTGVNPVTLRAWQRRYGLIKPARTESGHRLYSERDIELIRQILDWLNKGVSIGQVKSLLNNPRSQADDDNWQNIQHELLALAQDLKLHQLEAQIAETAKLYPAEHWLRNIIAPWLKKLSVLARPDRGLIEQTARHLLSSKIEKMITLQSGPRIALLQLGSISHLEAQLARYELQSLGCRSYDLGNTDPTQLALAADRLPVQAYILQLGSGLTANWFAQKQTRLPENCFYCGQLGLIYQGNDWLNLPYAESITQLVRQHETAFGLV